MPVLAVGANVGCQFAGLQLEMLSGESEVVAVVECAELEWAQIAQHHLSDPSENQNQILSVYKDPNLQRLQRLNFYQSVPQIQINEEQLPTLLPNDICQKNVFLYDIDPIYSQLVFQFNLSLFFLDPSMILSVEYNIKTAKKYKRIFQVHGALRETFLLLAQRESRQECVAHVDIRGQILFEYASEQPIESIAMISDREVVILETRNNSLLVIELQRYSTKRITHLFMFEQSDRSNVLTFPDRRLLCIEEKGKFGDSRYRLTYHEYSQLGMTQQQKTQTNWNRPEITNAKPINVYEATQEQWTYQNITLKANNKSMVCWFNSLESHRIKFHTYRLTQENKGELKVYQIKMDYLESVLKYVPKVEVRNCKEIKIHLEVGPIRIWEKNNGAFFIFCLTNCQNQREDPTTKLLVYDGVLHRLRESKFTLGRMQDYILDILPLGPRNLILTWGEEHERVKPTPLIFMDNETEGIIGAQSWQCNNSVGFQSCGYQEGIIVQCTRGKQDVERLNLIVRRLISVKELYLHVMLQSLQEIDEQLMSEVLKTICYTRY